MNKPVSSQKRILLLAFGFLLAVVLFTQWSEVKKGFMHGIQAHW